MISAGAIWTAIAYEASDGEVPNALQKIISTDSAGGHGILYQDLLGRTLRKSQ